MLTEEKKAGIVEKWKYFRECRGRKQKKLLNHSFAFYIEYDSGMEDAFRFELDGEEDLIGLGYAGPRKDDFVRIVTDLKEKDLQEAGYLYEPGRRIPDSRFYRDKGIDFPAVIVYNISDNIRQECSTLFNNAIIG